MMYLPAGANEAQFTSPRVIASKIIRTKKNIEFGRHK